MIKRSLHDITPVSTSHNVGQKRVLLSALESGCDIKQIAITDLKAGEIAAVHIHPDLQEGFYVLSGDLDVTLDEKLVHCHQDDFVYVESCTSHELHAITDVRVMTIGCQIETKANKIYPFLFKPNLHSVIWGGDQTIAELRKSELPPRTGEITFADRYSLAVIDSNAYLDIGDKKKVAEDFYKDTFFTDQNACTSPRIIVWTGDKINEAKVVFWEEEHALVEKRYKFQAIQGVNKLSKSLLVVAKESGVKIEPHNDNLIVRLNVSHISDDLMEYRDNSGYFYEYDCKDILDLIPLCKDKRCQTIAYIGDNKKLLPLLSSGVRGIDRIVPIGKTMDFDLIWDGYNLPALLTRTVVLT